MSTVRAVVVDPSAEGHLVIRDVPAPEPAVDEVIVDVEAISLNRGEVELAGTTAPAGWRPGRDVAGTVVRAAADGSGPVVGTRVVAMRDAPGVWAEQVAIPTGSVAPLPEGVTVVQAAALPVAALTALHALRKGGLLLGRRVLVTGSTGGVGLFAHQLARLAGATSVGLVRKEGDVARVRTAGADEVVVGDPAGIAAHGPFHLALDSVGGASLVAAAANLEPEGVCVNVGWSASAESRLDVMTFNRTGAATLYGLRLDTELRGRTKTADLALLARLVEAGDLDPNVEVERDWEDVASVADDLMRRRFTGKAVLRVGRR